MGARFLPLAVLLLGVGSGCTSGSVVFDLHTDLVAGVEFDEIVVATPSATLRAPASSSEEWLDGVRVGPLPSPEGSVLLTVEARLDGSVVVAQSVRTSSRGTLVVPIWLLRSCLDVVCPPAGAPGANVCRDGHCVAPDCVPGSPECPLGLCTTAADCPAATVPCARAACRETHCVIEPVPGACASGEHCHPSSGCEGAPIDAGLPDAPSCGASCDAGPCTLDASCVTDELLRWINVARASARTCGTTSMPAVPPLTAHPALESASFAHASYMARTHDLTLTGEGGSTAADRAEAAGYVPTFLVPGAFVMGYEETLQSVVDQMLADPMLCAQVMSAGPSEFGAAGADGAPDGIYWAWYAGRR